MNESAPRLIIHCLMKTRVNLTTLLLCIAAITTLEAAETSKPNIIDILCDDLGYGDVN